MHIEGTLPVVAPTRQLRKLPTCRWDQPTPARSKKPLAAWVLLRARSFLGSFRSFRRAEYHRSLSNGQSPAERGAGIVVEALQPSKLAHDRFEAFHRRAVGMEARKNLMRTNVVLLALSRKATCSASARGTEKGTLLPFPGRIAGMFTPEMRDSLVAFTLVMPCMGPIVFDVDEAGNETCRMANHVMVGWDCKQRLFLSDMQSGFVDHGPFRDMDEVCGLIAYIGM